MLKWYWILAIVLVAIIIGFSIAKAKQAKVSVTSIRVTKPDVKEGDILTTTDFVTL